MSPLIKVLVDAKVKKIDSLMDSIAHHIEVGHDDQALTQLNLLRAEIADVKRQLLN